MPKMINMGIGMVNEKMMVQMEDFFIVYPLEDIIIHSFTLNQGLCFGRICMSDVPSRLEVQFDAFGKFCSACLYPM